MMTLTMMIRTIVAKPHNCMYRTTYVYRPVEKMNAAEKELLNLLRREISRGRSP